MYQLLLVARSKKYLFMEDNILQSPHVHLVLQVCDVAKNSKNLTTTSKFLVGNFIHIVNPSIFLQTLILNLSLNKIRTHK